MKRPVVLAFGGNALLPDPEKPGSQEERAEAFARALKLILPEDAGMVLVHGNGPQVGMILLRIEATRERILPETLDILVAETQGSIGYLLCRMLRSEIPDRMIAAVLTQVLVDAEDPGFSKPSKPIGPYYSAEKARGLRELQGWSLAEVSGRGWRRVVPSPRPREILEISTVAHAAMHGHLVIAGGGGGIPVVSKKIGKNRLEGVEAVIDKDLTASLLAVQLDAQKLVILTDVHSVYAGYGTSRQEPISSMDVARAQSLLEAGEFSPGSMGPKVEACVKYCCVTGRAALITDIDHLASALERKAGTWITP
jgi:carbamate kinase